MSSKGIFNWEYMSFVNLDTTWLYREMLAIPVVVLILWVLWLRVVRSALKDEEEILLKQAAENEGIDSDFETLDSDTAMSPGS